MPNDALIKALAINGGTPVVSTPLSARHHFTEEEKAACNRVMDAAIAAGAAPGYGGAEETAFCQEFSAMLGGGYADAVCSGTDSVFVALRSLEIEPFTEIIAPPITDPGGFMPIVMMNCIPTVADAAPGSFNMSLEGVKKAYTPNTSAIVVAHIGGEPADIEGIMAFAKEKGLKVVEDCAQAHGASVHGKPVGTFGDINGFSLMFGKHVCVGGQGGIVFTKDEDLYWKVRQHSDRGKPFGIKSYRNVVASLNFNMDEMHAAIGRVQIQKTAAIAEGRRRVVAAIREGIADIPCFYWPELPDGALASYWFTRILFKPGYTSCTKKEFVEALDAEGVRADAHYEATPYTGSWYVNRHVFGKESQYPWAAPEYKGDREKRFTLEDLPNAAKALEDTVRIFPVESWTDHDIAQVVDAFHKVYEAYKI